mmetsp:Transcript_7731/g.10552  ORF Transcript_7731/g.10552 Transcript_7731/m.10552 type:complete len:399 (-) Transcript_7731:17-1213(-)
MNHNLKSGIRDSQPLKDLSPKTCGICLETAPNANACSGTNEQHYLCDSCFIQYARAELEPGGAYDSIREQGGGLKKSAEPGNNNHNNTAPIRLTSQPGHLPCYLFILGQCNCGSIPPTTIARILSSDADALKLHDLARCRVYAAKQEADRIKAEQAEKEKKKTSSRMDLLRDAVREALSRGGHVSCPSCGSHAQKNDACMHMNCPCGTSYCYCCGRRRSRGVANAFPLNYCRGGCDERSPYLEHNPGWANLNILEGETQGMGALHEFHKRRMMYFLRGVKDTMQPNEWEELKRTSPELLDNVPTVGRFIIWDDIDRALPPLFGSTREHQLQWANEGNNAIADVEHDVRQRANNPGGDTQEGYKFGDITRGVIAKGKRKDGRSQNDRYRFGDFTRGLLG